MEVDMEQASIAEWDLVETVVQLGEQPRVAAQPPRPAPESASIVGPSTRSRTSESSRTSSTPGTGKPRALGVLHDLGLPGRAAARLKTPEHAVLAQLEDLRCASFRQHPHGP